MDSIRKFITAVVVCLPLLRYYKAPFLVSELASLLVIVLLPLAVFVILAQSKKLSLKNIKEYGILITWMIFISLIMILFAPYDILSHSNLNSFIFFVILFFLLLLGLSGVFDFDFGIRIYTAIIIILTAFLALQIFLFYIFKFPLDLKLPFFRLLEIYDGHFNYLARIIGLNINARFSSFFSEPSHYAQYVLPFLCMKLFGYKNMVKKNLVHAIIVTIFILLSVSGNGIVTAAIIWGAYFVSRGNKNVIKNTIWTVIGIVVIGIVYNLLLNFSGFSDSFNRMFTSSGDISSKADYRIYRGFLAYTRMPLIHQLFGVGFKNFTAAMLHYGIYNQFDRQGVNPEYLNAIAQILIYSGIIGIFLYGLMLIGFYRRTDICGKVLVITFFALCISSSIFMDTTWLLYMLLIFACIKSNGLDKNLKYYSRRRKNISETQSKGDNSKTLTQ